MPTSIESGNVSINFSSSNTILFDVTKSGTTICSNITINEAKAIRDSLNNALDAAEEFNKPVFRDLVSAELKGSIYFFIPEAVPANRSESIWRHSAEMVIDQKGNITKSRSGLTTPQRNW